MKGDVRCIEGRLWRHDPQQDDPYLETNIGPCPGCGDCDKDRDYFTCPTCKGRGTDCPHCDGTGEF